VLRNCDFDSPLFPLQQTLECPEKFAGRNRRINLHQEFHKTHMMKSKILVIDDDAYVTQLLTQILTRAKYEVSTAHTGREALALATAGAPNLIILDLMLPDGDSYELLEKIKKARGTAFPPVLVLTSSHETEDELRGLRLGVVDYVTKPFERQDLLRRVKNLIDYGYAKTGRPAPSRLRSASVKFDDSGAESLLLQTRCEERDSLAAIAHRKVLALLESGELQSLAPRLRHEAKLGYDYPEAASAVQPEEPGAEVLTLEEMAREQLLERTFADAVQICPVCSHHDVNFRTACPSCLSVNVEPESERPQNGAAPDQSLAGLYKIEYDDSSAPARTRPSSNGRAYFCAACQKTITRPLQICRCMKCGEQFDADKAVARKIYSYKLRRDLAKPAAPISAPSDWGKLPALFKQFELPALDAESFRRQVGAHVDRAKQRNSNFSLIGLHLNKMLEGHDEKDRACELLDALKKTLRRFDLIGVRSPAEWMILLPETPFTMAKILASRLFAACERLAWEQPLDMSLASYPEDGVRAEELLEILELGIVTMPKG
jgi:DNA-binding response OmpR family regulator